LIELAHINDSHNTMAAKALTNIDEFVIDDGCLDLLHSCTATAAAIWLIRHTLVKIVSREFHFKQSDSVV